MFPVKPTHPLNITVEGEGGAKGGYQRSRLECLARNEQGDDGVILEDTDWLTSRECKVKQSHVSVRDAVWRRGGPYTHRQDQQSQNRWSLLPEKSFTLVSSWACISIPTVNSQSSRRAAPFSSFPIFPLRNRIALASSFNCFRKGT